MGGYGSGRRWSYEAKDTTGSYRFIDVRQWHREGLITPNQSFAWKWLRQGENVGSIQVRTEPNRVILDYRQRSSPEDDWVNEHYPVYLDWTPCHFGGKRPWFLCPTRGCGRRVAILYGGVIFACRHCCRLAYPSQNETDYDRAGRRAEKIRDRLGWELGFLNEKGGKKPKGMHWKTFERLSAQHDEFVGEAIAGIASLLRISDDLSL